MRVPPCLPLLPRSTIPFSRLFSHPLRHHLFRPLTNSSAFRAYASPAATPPTLGGRLPGLMTDSPYEKELLEIVSEHPLVNDFMETRPGFTTSRAVLRPRAEELEHNLTRGPLLGPGMISANPFVLVDDARGALLAFYRLGNKLAGHKGIVHGGMTAVLLDECCGRVAFAVFKRGVAVTASLDMEYLEPIMTDSYVMVAVEAVKVEGRKVWIEARIEDAKTQEVLVQAKGLFIEPKWAKI